LPPLCIVRRLTQLPLLFFNARATPSVPSSLLTAFSCLVVRLAPAVMMAQRKQRPSSPEFPILDANALYAGQIRGDGELAASLDSGTSLT